MDCVCCGQSEAHIHHIKTRGAYPELVDKEWNHMPLCFICHRKAHDIGLNSFYTNNKNVRNYLLSIGWVLESNKWIKE